MGFNRQLVHFQLRIALDCSGLLRLACDLDGDKLPEGAWTLIRYCVESTLTGDQQSTAAAVKLFPAHVEEVGKDYQHPDSDIAAAVAWSRDDINVWTLLTTVHTLKFLHVQELGV
ncbi:MAG: hypothetical protein ACOYBP_09030 [Microbacteriaceae bacterium]